MSPEPPAQPDRKGIDRELRRGSLELAILHLLSSGEAYGYEIVSKLTARTNGATVMGCAARRLWPTDQRGNAAPPFV
jgi:hypothetical protein